MIVQFSVGNFLSFKELSTLSLVATNLKETAIADADSMAEMDDAIPAILHGAAIYGANASGKSNFAKALSTFKWLVINSMKELQAGEALNVESFMLNVKTAHEPSLFEWCFAMMLTFTVMDARLTAKKCIRSGYIEEITRSVQRKWSCFFVRTLHTMFILRVP